MTGCSSMIFSLQPRKLLIHDLFTFRRFVGIVAHAVYMCMYIYIYMWSTGMRRALMDVQILTIILGDFI